MLKLIRTKLNKKQIDFVNENKAIINKRSHDIPQELEHNSYLNRGNTKDTNKIASTITKKSQIYTPFIINPKNSQLENQKYQQEDLEQPARDEQKPTQLAQLKRYPRSDSDSDPQLSKDTALLNAILRKAKKGQPKILEKDRLKEIEECLSKGANINVVNKNDKGNTVLHIAVKKNYQDIVKFLLEKGAKVNIQNYDNKTPLDIAESNHQLVQILTKSINVPGDGSCLFWAVTLAYLTTVKNDDEAFEKKFKKLFGSENHLPEVKTLIQNYNPFIEQENALDDKTLKYLITNQFRRKVVDYMRSNPTDFKELAEGEMTITFEQYLDQMSLPGKWGGELEIKAMSKILECTIQVYSASVSIYESGNDHIKLYHESLDVNNLHNRNHYNFGVDLNIIDSYTRIPPLLSLEKRKYEDEDIEDSELQNPKRQKLSNQNKSRSRTDKDSEEQPSRKKIKTTDTDNISVHEEFLHNQKILSEGSKLTQHGNIFQLKLLMLFLWRAKENNYNKFRLA